MTTSPDRAVPEANPLNSHGAGPNAHRPLARLSDGRLVVLLLGWPSVADQAKGWAGGKQAAPMGLLIPVEYDRRVSWVRDYQVEEVWPEGLG